MTEKPKNIFEDLGKPTLRGVRKCPKCGTYNGTRGLSCKNQNCKLIFKVVKDKNRSESETGAVKVVNGTNLQIYSVRLQNFNDDQRCFVHLPLIEGIEALQDKVEVSVIIQSAAICYAPSCRKPLDDSCSITLNLNPCVHTHAVVNCVVEAEPLNWQEEVLKSMPISDEIKEEIWSIVSKAEEPVVQRIAKNVLVIKCNPDDQHPLGFLHFSVFAPNKSCRKFKILCGCQSELAKPSVPKEKLQCVHFYMCVCAMASDAKLLEEFSSLIQPVLTLKLPAPPIGIDANPSEINVGLKDIFPDNTCPPIKRKKTDVLDTNTLYFVQENNIVKTVMASKKGSNSTKKQIIDSNDTIVSINFEQWLASVTERINQTMHYQYSGNVDPLVFSVPQKFFDILQHRISAGSKKKRLPNSVVAFSRKDILPDGVLSKYTWHITNILHIKRIFDTPEMPLDITRSFIENRDGTFVPYDPCKHDKEDLSENFRKTLNNILIKPLELKTFLKVGHMTLDQKEPIPFIIEWIPDILPKTHVGELRIKFQYGHQKNGFVENIHSAPDNMHKENPSSQ